ncbi:MAG: C40 family peptidase [Bacteroidota bacterium]
MAWSQWPLWVFSLLLFAGCQTEQVPVEVSAIVERIQQEHIPDRRVDRFDIVVEKRNGEYVLTGETTRPELLDSLENQLKSKGYEATSEVLTLPSEDLEDQIWGIVRLSVANLRSQPKHSAELASQLLMGMPIRVLKQEEDWYFVQAPDQYLGWLDAEAFVSVTEEELVAWQQLPKGIVTRPEVVVKENRGLYPVSDLVAGNMVAILMEEAPPFPGTFPVMLPDGRKGFVGPLDLVRLDQWMLQVNGPNHGMRMAMAQSFLGRPYLWGGTSSKGFDCSGFTKTVYYLNGLIIPRDASQQIRAGEEIATDTTWTNLEPGDFLFFGRAATPEQKEKITHVAFYLGEGKILHATGRVKIESLRRSDPDFAENRFDTFIRAKRLNADSPGVLAIQDMPWYGLKE